MDTTLQEAVTQLRAAMTQANRIYKSSRREPGDQNQLRLAEEQMELSLRTIEKVVAHAQGS